MLDISVIIVNWNVCALLSDCLSSLLKEIEAHPKISSETIVVDNQSSDCSVAMVRERFPWVTVIANEKNLGFGRANNQALPFCHGRYLLLLNPDTLIHPGAVQQLFSYLEGHPEAGMVGPKLVNTDGSLQRSIFPRSTLFRETWRLAGMDRFLPLSEYPPAFHQSEKPLEVDVLKGACILLRQAALAGMPLFDEQFFMFSEEVDLCRRIRQKGWDIRWLPTARVTHHGERSVRQLSDAMFLELFKNKVKFLRKSQGACAARIFKGVLWITAIIKIGIIRGLYSKRTDLATKARQYQMLLKALRRY